jgi:hypothetical protein
MTLSVATMLHSGLPITPTWRANLADRPEGADEKVVVEEVLRAVAEDNTGSGHHAA